MARHAAVDLAQVVNARYDPQAAERLTDAEFDSAARNAGGCGIETAQRR